MVKYIQFILKVGQINTYPAINTVKYIISRIDLQEVAFPLMIQHGLFFLTNVVKHNLIEQCSFVQT